MRKSWFFGCFLLLCWARSAHAVVSVDPTVLRVNVPPGGSYAGKIRVKNPAKDPLEVSVKVMDWQYETPGGSKKLLPSGTTKTSCAQWLSIFPDKVKLEPQESKEFSYNVTVPTQAAGGYYSVIMFSAMLPHPDQQQGITINMAIQIGTLVLLEIDDTQTIQGALTKFDAVPPKPGQPLNVKVSFKNQGNVRIEAKGRLSIMNAKGQAVGWTKFSDVKTLPGDEWEAKASWTGALAPGPYHLVATFELAPGHVLVEEKDIQIK